MSVALVIDYGMGNLDSVVRAVEVVGHTALRTDDPRDATHATHIILPGVGAYGDAMENLVRLGWPSVLRTQVTQLGIPCLGICLGMQVLAQKGHEGGEHRGLGFICGEVVPLDGAGAGVRVPHVGWNSVVPIEPSSLFVGIEPGTDFYFVHSFHMICAHREDVLATTPYGETFVSAVRHGRVFGVQFHPEKSQAAGLRLLSNFLEP